MKNCAPPETHNRGFFIDVWPFAMCKEFYKQVMRGLTKDEPFAHTSIVTTSAHPAPILASLDMQATVHVCLDRVKPHARKHGDKLLHGTRLQRFLSDEKSSETVLGTKIRNSC